MPPEPLIRGLPPPDPGSLCPLSSTEYVDPPFRTKFLGTPLLGSLSLMFRVFGRVENQAHIGTHWNTQVVYKLTCVQHVSQKRCKNALHLVTYLLQ
jgi:hypothetical protein